MVVGNFLQSPTSCNNGTGYASQGLPLKKPSQLVPKLAAAIVKTDTRVYLARFLDFLGHVFVVILTNAIGVDPQMSKPEPGDDSDSILN